MSADQPDLTATRTFWDANPCGVHGSFAEIRAQRYAMEPWSEERILRIAASHSTILEVGCGQGTDSIVMCSNMAAGGRFVAIDYSPNSVEVAKRNAASQAGSLAVTPSYQVGNAEALAFDDETFDAVYSGGVIHHTANPARAIGEVHRVLKRGGTAYVALYRRPSLKVGVAKALRGIQRGLDLALGTDRCVYSVLRKRGTSSRLFGTMFHECFGVPYLGWYTKSEIDALFRPFSAVTVRPFGASLGRFSSNNRGESRGGYLWWIEAVK